MQFVLITRRYVHERSWQHCRANMMPCQTNLLDLCSPIFKLLIWLWYARCAWLIRHAFT